MAVVKIILEGDETCEEVEEDLVKAIESKNDLELESKRYDDPLMNLLVDQMDSDYIKMYNDTIRGILEILKE